MVLPFLAKHNIPASPLNYQIGYEFVSGNNTALKSALVSLLKDSEKISDKDLFKLYKKYIAQDYKSLETIRQELQNIIGNIQSEHSNSSSELCGYIGSLNKFVEILDGDGEKSQLSTETQKMVENTRSTEQHQRKFETQMSSMMEEIETLRGQLEQVREESMTDALTGLANRKAFDQMLEQAIQDNGEQESPFCLIIGDIDHFKMFNDTYGHLVGDKVLRYVGKTIKACVKGKDMAARFGGEEFVLVLPDTDIKGGEIVAEQVRNAISKSNLTDHKNNQEYGKITISLGIGQYQAGEQPNQLLERTDKALYQAKKNGRNRVEISS